MLRARGQPIQDGRGPDERRQTREDVRDATALRHLHRAPDAQQRGGTKLEVTSGYRSLGAAALAVEKSEVSGMCGWGYASLRALRANWFAKKFIRILIQVGREKHPDLQDVPLASDLAKADKKAVLEVYNKQLSVGRPWTLPPGVAPERVATMRQAFVNVMKDPAFLADAKKARIQINPLPGKELQALVEKMIDHPGGEQGSAEEDIQLLSSDPKGSPLGRACTWKRKRSGSRSPSTVSAARAVSGLVSGYRSLGRLLCDLV